MKLSHVVVITIFLADPVVQAEAESATSLKKIIATQQAEIAQLKKSIEALRVDTDKRFKAMSVSVSGTQTYYEKEIQTGYEPRDTFIWNQELQNGRFTGFHCPTGLVSSGADYWSTPGYFHRSYCRVITIKDEGWKK